MLEEFLGREVTAPIYGKGWVDLMIDVDRDTSGKAVNERYKKGRSGGLPWTVIVGPDGEASVPGVDESPSSSDGDDDGFGQILCVGLLGGGVDAGRGFG